jgi:putative transposase
LIVDNYCTPKHAKVRTWLAKRPRFHVPFTPAYASWLNQVERWFGIITERVIRRGSFRSVKELIAKIEQLFASYNKAKAPFIWSATADSIFEKIQRLCVRISGSAH